MIRLLRQGLPLGMLCLLLAACAATPPGTQTGVPAASATPLASPTATATGTVPVVTPGPAASATAPLAINCGLLAQSADGGVAPPAPNYSGITTCFTGAFSGCQPAFLEFTSRGTDYLRDFTFTVERKDGVCQVRVNDHVQTSKGSETRHFYYCTHADQSGPKAVLSGCDTHFTNGTLSVPA